MRVRRSHFWTGQCVSLHVAMYAFAALLSFPSGTTGQATVDAVTFTRDVAPILQENCEVCHRPGSIG